MPPTDSLAAWLQIDTLGGLSIVAGADLTRHESRAGDAPRRRLHFDARTADALLVYLACRRRPLARETLAEFLWPERSHAQALANLRSCIHRLRAELAPLLAMTRQEIGFTPEASIRVDVIALEAHLQAGRLSEALALYTGDFLDGFFLDGSPAFEEWVRQERERLRNLVIAAYQQLIAQGLNIGEYETAIGHAERLLQLDPCHEPTHRQLMRLLALTGRRGAAIAHYAVCRQLLDQELGVPPDETTTALYEEIRSGASMDGAQGRHESTAHSLAASPHPIPSLRQHALPQPTLSLIGRETELAQIATLLVNPDCRLVSLIGLGGIGKTRLAIETARRMQSHFRDGVFFVSLAPVASADYVPVAIIQSLGLQTGQTDLIGQIAAHVQSRHVLFVLDNFEHLLDAANIVASLLQRAPGAKILVTSRTRLNVLDEWLLPITGLPVAERLAGAAEQLFLRSARRVRPDFDPRGEEDAIGAVCRYVEGMPLAIELAASWVRVMPCAAIASTIAQDPELLSTSLRDVPERHRNLRSLFDQTWQLLSPVEQTVLRRLCVFRGGWASEQAAAVAGATRDVLSDLVDKSLVRVTQQGRFDLHELVRQFGAGQLRKYGEDGVIHRHHFTAYLELMRSADAMLRGPEAVTWYARLEPEQDNLRAALQWALDGGHFTDAAWLAVALNYYWYIRGYWHEGSRVLQPLLAHIAELGPELRLATLHTFFSFWRSLGDLPSIDRYTLDLPGLIAECTQVTLRVAGWRMMTMSTADMGRAMAYWDKCLELARAAVGLPGLDKRYCHFADATFSLAVALIRFAVRLVDGGEIERAARHSREALVLLQTQGNRDFIAFAYGNLGRVALHQGDVALARQFLQEAVAIATAVDNRVALADWQPRLALATLYAGDAPTARKLLDDCLHLCTALKGDLGLARVYTYLAQLALWEGDLDRAESWLAHSVAHHANPRWIRIELVECLWVAACLASARGHFMRAAIFIEVARRSHTPARDTYAAPLRARVDAVQAQVEEVLGAEQFAAAPVLGQETLLHEALAMILAPDRARRPI